MRVWASNAQPEHLKLLCRCSSHSAFATSVDDCHSCVLPLHDESGLLPHPSVSGRQRRSVTLIHGVPLLPPTKRHRDDVVLHGALFPHIPEASAPPQKGGRKGEQVYPWS